MNFYLVLQFSTYQKNHNMNLMKVKAHSYSW